MSETITDPNAGQPTPGSDPAATPAPVAAPEGYVPLSEVEKAREEGRRAAQSEYDRRLHAELQKVKGEQPPTPKTEDGGFDPVAFRTQLLQDVYGATALSDAASKARADFPHADPALFSPEKLATFASPEALRFAAEDSHKRVAAILDAELKARDEAARAAAAAAADGSQGPPGNTPPPAGDPTPEQLNSMSLSELDALEQRSPGVVKRVMGLVR